MVARCVDYLREGINPRSSSGGSDEHKRCPGPCAIVEGDATSKVKSVRNLVI